MFGALGTPLTDEEAARFDETVAPRCRALFEARLLEAMVPGDDASVVHLGCRTGYHDEVIARRAGASSLIGIDASPAALALAQRRSPNRKGPLSYSHVEMLPCELPDECYSHVVSLYSLALQDEAWINLAAESARLLQPGGQLLLALPLRGSFQELTDLLREFALACGAPEAAEIVEDLSSQRPSIERVSDELDTAGFSDVDVSLHRLALEYDSGSEFLEDDVARLLFEPHLRALFPGERGEQAVDHVRRAVGAYWATLPFELSINLGCASAVR
jgi:SAM-dependent methyltransferase